MRLITLAALWLQVIRLIAAHPVESPGDDGEAIFNPTNMTTIVNGTTSLGITKWPDYPWIWRFDPGSPYSNYELNVVTIVPWNPDKPGIDSAEIGEDITEFRNALAEDQKGREVFDRDSRRATFILYEAGAELSLSVATTFTEKKAPMNVLLAALDMVAATYRNRLPASLTMVLREVNTRRWGSWFGLCGIVINLKELTALPPVEDSIRRVNVTEVA